MSQTSQIVIANQAGAPYRAAVNSMLSALNTTFSGDNPPTTTEAYMNWLDTSVTPNVLKRRNSSDTAWETHPLQALADANKITADAAMPRSGGDFTGPANANKGADIASSATTDIFSATGEYVVVTGTTTITGLGTAQAGAEREVRFDGILTITHNATSLVLPTGTNILTAAGDVARFRSEGGGNVRCVSYNRADGNPIATPLANQRITLTAAVATTSGNFIDFTGIPSWAKKITVVYSGISTTETSAQQFIVQLGTSGGVATSGYAGGSSVVSSTSASSSTHTNGAVVVNGAGAVTAFTSGATVIYNLSGNSWEISGKNSRTDASAGGFHNASITLGATLDRVRLQVFGAGSFDAGNASLIIEGTA